MNALPTFGVEANSLQTDVNSKQTLAAASQVAAATSETNAAASAAAAAGTANVTLWVSGTTYNQYDSVISPADKQTYRRITSTGSGVTDPSADTTNYTRLTGSGLVLIATISPTVSANVDFLSTFKSVYNNYLVIYEGIKPTADDTLCVQMAVAGVASTAAHYAGGVGSTVTSSFQFMNISSQPVTSAGAGTSGEVTVFNTNSTTTGKTISNHSSCQTTGGANSFFGNSVWGVFPAASVVTGVRFFWSNGNNFSATGKIKIYAVANT